MAKIAMEMDRTGPRHNASALVSRQLACGDGWTADYFICNSGPADRPFEERHSSVSIAIVTSGTFQYRAGNGASGELMTPGSILLGNDGQHFECGHEHASGDRCISFHYAAGYFDQIAAEAGVAPADRTFRVLRLPALRDASLPVSRAVARLSARSDAAASLEWGELAIEIAAFAVGLANRSTPRHLPDLPSATARVTRAVRLIEQHLRTSDSPELSLATLARESSLSPYHFLRTFERVTGVTPHQYVRRTRLRMAAARLAADSAKILDIALDCGFGDVSNFNHSFRSEFGMNPQAFRKRNRG